MTEQPPPIRPDPNIIGNIEGNQRIKAEDRAAAQRQLDTPKGWRTELDGDYPGGPTWHRNPNRHLKRHAGIGLIVAVTPGVLVVTGLIGWFRWGLPW